MSLHSSTTFRAREAMSVFALRLFSRMLQELERSHILEPCILSPLTLHTSNSYRRKLLSQCLQMQHQVYLTVLTDLQ